MDDKKKKLDKLTTDFQKAFGAGSVVELSNAPKVNYEAYSTGSIALDVALGTGGFVKGKIFEIYGQESVSKTTLCLHAAAACQAQGGTVLFVDAEHAFDLEYATKLGIKKEGFYLESPDSTEQAMEVIEKFVRTGVDMVILDSIAALIPESEVQADAGKSAVGVQAKLMNQLMRKITGPISKNGTVALFINQLREKIGVMFGCFPYKSKVLLADGSYESIGKIVNQQMEVDVLTWNEETKMLEPKPIINWYNNGRYENLWVVETLSPHKNGITRITVADDHVFYTVDGMQAKLSELEVGDYVLTPSKNYLNNEQLSLIVGGYLGDGSVRTKNGATFRYRETHGIEQNEYCEWKARILGDFISTSGYNKKGQFWFECHNTNELEFLAACKEKGLTCLTNEVLERIDLLSLAIWFLDDGTFQQKGSFGTANIGIRNLSNYHKEKILATLRKKFNLHGRVCKSGIAFYGKECERFQLAIAQYVPKCMEFKLHPDMRQYVGLHDYNSKCDIRDVLVEVPILSIKKGKNRRSPFKYDIQIEGNSNYFIGNVLVHNSPWTTTGGNAMKFYAHARLNLARIKTHKDRDGNPVAIDVKAKIDKNKLAAPAAPVVYRVVYGKGIDRVLEILELAIEHGIIEKSGSWYKYDGNNIGQGEETACDFLRDNEELAQSILDDVFGEPEKDNDEN